MNTPQAPTLTEAELREIAATICSSFEKADAFKARVTQFDAETSAKLAALDNEISDLDRRADGENTDAIQMLVIKREQRTRLAAKLAVEREDIVSEVNRQARDAVRHHDLPKLFHDATRAERAAVVAHLLPHCETEGRALGLSAHVDSLNSLDCWARELVFKIPGHIIAQRLRAFVSGEKPIWRI